MRAAHQFLKQAAEESQGFFTPDTTAAIPPVALALSLLFPRVRKDLLMRGNRVHTIPLLKTVGGAGAASALTYGGMKAPGVIKSLKDTKDKVERTADLATGAIRKQVNALDYMPGLAGVGLGAFGGAGIADLVTKENPNSAASILNARRRRAMGAAIGAALGGLGGFAYANREALLGKDDPSKKASAAEGGKFKWLDSWLEKNPTKGRAIIDAILNTRTGMGLLGGAAGTLGGALVPTGEDKVLSWKRLRNALIGGGLGTGAGVATGHFAPEFSRDLLKGTASSLITRPAGRLLTNAVMPRGYDNKLERLINVVKNDKLKAVKLLLGHDPWEGTQWTADKDVTKEQSYPDDSIPAGKVIDVDRELPYRFMFGLTPRAQARYYALNPDGSRRLNADQEADMVASLFVNPPRLQEDILAARPIQAQEYSVMGNYLAHLDPKTMTVRYQDPWDFALHSNEKEIKDTTSLLRHVISKFISPVTFKGEAPLTEAQANQVREWVSPPAPEQPAAELVKTP